MCNKVILASIFCSQTQFLVNVEHKITLCFVRLVTHTAVFAALVFLPSLLDKMSITDMSKNLIFSQVIWSGTSIRPFLSYVLHCYINWFDQTLSFDIFLNTAKLDSLVLHQVVSSTIL